MSDFVFNTEAYLALYYNNANNSQKKLYFIIDDMI